MVGENLFFRTYDLEKGYCNRPNKSRNCRQLETIRKPTDIRNFVGLTGYYCQFIKDFSKLAGPLTDLTKKHGRFVWVTRCETSFQELKKILTMTPVLTLPNGKDSFTVYTDASSEELGTY